MYLTQIEKLFIASHTGNHPDNEGQEPLAQEESGPRFPYAAIRHKIKDYAPPVPRCYGGRDDGEAADDEESTEDELLDETLKTFCRSKQGHESSPWLLPSARSRRDVFQELRSMGCTMEG